MTHTYKIEIEATSAKEADEKVKAVLKLARQLDCKTLTALADKIPGVLNNPILSGKVKSFLGLR
jgi:hypothetical protein